MKKLLLVLMVVAMASFLFVGCIPGGTTPDTDTDTDAVVSDCPAVAVTTQVAIAGKNYIKSGTQTITVTFAVPTAPVSVFVGGAIRGNPEGVPDDAKEVVMHTADGGLTYTGTFKFGQGPIVDFTDCNEDYIYVLTCDTCAPCKYPYIVDNTAPTDWIKITSKACTCEGFEVTFKTNVIAATDCVVATDCCGYKECSGLASWTIDIYDRDPVDECCLATCWTPIDTCSGDACPIDCTTMCLVTYAGGAEKTYYAIITLADAVGNKTKYYVTLIVTTTGVRVYNAGIGTVPCEWTSDAETTDLIGVDCTAS